MHLIRILNIETKHRIFESALPTFTIITQYF